MLKGYSGLSLCPRDSLFFIHNYLQQRNLQSKLKRSRHISESKFYYQCLHLHKFLLFCSLRLFLFVEFEFNLNALTVFF